MLAIVVAFARGTVAAVSTDLIRLFGELPAGFVAFLVGFVQLLAVLAPLVLVVTLLWRRALRELGALALAGASAVATVASASLARPWRPVA